MENKEVGFINWWEFSPTKDHFICRSIPDETKKVSESGIIFAAEVNVIMDRPFRGEVIAVGPEAKFEIGDYLYWRPESGMDLAMIRPQVENEKYILLYEDSVLGKKVQDTRFKDV